MEKLIREAIEKAVAEEGQSKELTEKLISWFTNVANASEKIDDRDSALRRSELCLENVTIDEKE